MKTSKGDFPFKWPFPPRPRTSRSERRSIRPNAGLTRKAMLADVVLVIFWGASIPGLMWLGAAGGF